MATFSTNQARQLFVVKAYSANAVTEADAVGTVSVHSNNDDIYLLYRGVGGLMRSDLIKKTNITYAKATPATSLQRSLRSKLVSLDPNVNGGDPVAGENYLLRITFQQFIGLSHEDQYFKYGAVRAAAGMTADTFYKTLIESLNLNFARELVPLLSFSLYGDTASAVLDDNDGVTVTAVDNGVLSNNITFVIAAVDAVSASVTVTGTAISVSLTAAAKTIGDLKDVVEASAEASALVTIAGVNATEVVVESSAVALTGGTSGGVRIDEIAQPYSRGKKESVPLLFYPQADMITVTGQEVVWGVTTDLDSWSSVTSAYPAADMEYFYMGERGDIYRGVGFPHDLETTYLVELDKEYAAFDLHYFYQGANEAVQKSEKDISLLVISDADDGEAGSDIINDVIEDINTAYGSTLVALLPTS